MDTFTHALLGATVAHVAVPRRSRLTTRERLLLGGMAASFPDIDFVGFLFNPLMFLADWHQGPTHSLVLVPLWAVLIGGLFTRLMGRRPMFGEAVFVSGLAIGSHIASDLITAYGTAVLFPLSDRRLSFATTFVIDPWFTGIVLVGLVLSLWTAWRTVAGIGLVVLCLYVAGQAALQSRALQVGWESLQARGLAIEELSALAQPLSPFNWKLIGVEGPRYYQAYVNLAGHGPPMAARLGRPAWLQELADTYRPPAQLTWEVRHRYGEQPELRPLVERRWQDPRFEPFRRFAAYPSLSRIDSRDGETCVWFTDLRYDLPALPDTFRYGFCRVGSQQPWYLYRLRYFSEGSRHRLSC